MKIQKRNGRLQEVKFDKIVARIKKMMWELDHIDYHTLAKKVIDGFYDGISSKEVDDLIAETAASMATYHYNYNKLAGRIKASVIHKETPQSFLDAVKLLYEKELVSYQLLNNAINYEKQINNVINNDLDFEFDYFGIKTLEKAYLLKINKRLIERPQYMFMRVAIGIHGNDIDSALQTYFSLSQGKYIHATPTLYNAGTNRPQLSSCFLLGMDDSVDGMYDSIKQMANISKYSGGIGVSISDIRGDNSYIKGTGGTSSGIIPLCKVLNETARHINQGGKRKGSIAVYIEPWHSDIFEFLDLKKNHGAEERRARDLFYALWISDLFMERVKNDEIWSLFSPDVCPELSNTYGKEFEEIYINAEKAGKFARQVKARDLWVKILQSQIETGTPYMLYKDISNKASNQQNLGTIKNSNLCITGDQRVLSTHGYLTAKELHDLDEELTLFNGKEPVRASKMKLRGKNEDVYKITLENGMEIKVTPYHGIPVIDDRNNVRRLECKDLKIGDKVPVQTQKGIFGALNCEREAYSYAKQNISNVPRWIWESNAITQLSYLSGLDNFLVNGKYYNSSKNFLLDIQLLLTNLGFNSNVNYNESSGVYKLELVELNEKKKPSKVKSIEYAGRKDVYCPTVYNDEHIFVAQGMLTFNCAEIVEYSDSNETAVCNLASIAVNKFYDANIKEYDYESLGKATQELVINLNKIIDVNFYPTEEAKRSNLKHRPIGIGIQGLANLFADMKVPFTSDIAKEVNRKIAETMYYYALKQSCQLAEKSTSYSSYKNSPLSNGKFHFELYDNFDGELSYDWEVLRQQILKYGVKNSLLLCNMPTASSSQILGNNECFEPFTSNIYVRRTLSGDHFIINKNLIDDLIELDLWNDSIRQKMMANNGSIQSIIEIPENIKEIYKTAYEIRQSELIKMAMDRQYFIDQSQSMNLWMQNPTFTKLNKAHFLGWKLGLKTGMYYLRSNSAVDAIKFTVKEDNDKKEEKMCLIDDPNCEACSA